VKKNASQTPGAHEFDALDAAIDGAGRNLERLGAIGIVIAWPTPYECGRRCGNSRGFDREALLRLRILDQRRRCHRRVGQRSKANLRLLDRRGLTPEFQRAKPRGKPMPTHIRRGNATRAKVRSRVEHVFAAEKRRLHLVIRTIGLARASAKIALANLVYNFNRFAWLEGRALTA
jgi:hypothetical protein